MPLFARLCDRYQVRQFLRLSDLRSSPALLFICEILMFFKTCSMLSFTLRSGSRIVQRSLWPHSPRTVTHAVIKSGPSIALITSNAEIVRGSRASVYPPLMPCCDCTSPTLASRCKNLRQGFLRNAIRLGYVFGAARAAIDVLSQMLHGHQPVIGFFGQLQHDRRQIKSDKTTTD